MHGILLTINWVIDTLFSFAPQLVLLLATGFAVALWRKATFAMIGCLMGVGIGWGAMALSTLNHAPTYPPDEVKTLGTLKTLTFDLHAENHNYEKVLDYIWDADADLVCLQEANTDGWRTAVRSLLRVYRHALVSAHGGTVLLSRTPVDIKPAEIGPAKPRTIGVVSKSFGRPIDIYCTHLSEGGSPMTAAQRNQELGFLARDIFRSRNPVVVLGNLNASSRAPAMFRFLQHTDLKTATLGFPPANTWPSSMPFLGLRVDHVLASPPFIVTGRKTGPALGSNHRPMHVNLALPMQDKVTVQEALARVHEGK